MIHDVGQLHPEPSSGDGFIGDTHLDPPPEEDRGPPKSEGIRSWMWTPAFPRIGTPERERIDSARRKEGRL